MKLHTRSLPRHVRAAWLLAIGLFAVAMHVFGGTGVMRGNAGVGSFYAEICTAAGVSKIDPAQPSGNSSLPDSGHHDCCKLCTASAFLLTADLALAVPPAPTFVALLVAPSVLRPAAVVWVSHPPRGPPRV